MQINLPILDELADCETIFICGAGGGFDVYAGLPLYFDLTARGKKVHLGNFSFTDPNTIRISDMIRIDLEPECLTGVYGRLNREVPYFPEGYLSDWFAREQDPINIWMFHRPGVQTLIDGYNFLKDKLTLDALILIDGGVDSLMQGNESHPGTMLEDSVSITAANEVDFPVKILASLGFGTEVEEGVDHYSALENMAMYIKAGGFYGACALTPQMTAFQQYEAICRHAWKGSHRAKSHISTRVIPAVNGEFGNYHMYDDERDPLQRKPTILVSPLMTLYWFFDSDVVADHNLLCEKLRHTRSLDEARLAGRMHMLEYGSADVRSRRSLPY